MTTVGESVDDKITLLKYIQNVNTAFYNEFSREFLKDKSTLTTLEKDLVEALAAVAGIIIKRSEVDLDRIWVTFKSKNSVDMHEEFSSFKDALTFSIGLLFLKG